MLPHQQHDSHPILADYETDRFSIRMNDKVNDIVGKPLTSFYFKSVIPFQSKFKSPNIKHTEILHQQFILLIDTDITSDDEEHIHSKFPKPDFIFVMTILYMKKLSRL